MQIEYNTTYKLIIEFFIIKKMVFDQDQIFFASLSFMFEHLADAARVSSSMAD